MSIMYYELSSGETSGDALVIGPLKITIQQIGIGITVNLLVMPPSMLLIALFTKSKRRVTQAQAIKNKLDKNEGYIKRQNLNKSLAPSPNQSVSSASGFDSMSQKPSAVVGKRKSKSAMSTKSKSSNKSLAQDIKSLNQSHPSFDRIFSASDDQSMSEKSVVVVVEPKKVKRPFLLPWWCKIFAYLLSLAIVLVSIFFIAIKGVVLGDEKVKEWLTSFVTSIFSSVLLTQPIKVNNTKISTKSSPTKKE